jgi:hypothetical protein
MHRQLSLILLFVTSVAASDPPREILWDQLVPADWNPYAAFDALSDEDYAALTDEEYTAMYDEAQRLFADAPVVEEFDGERVKIPGFVLPLSFDGTKIRDFLLLPSRGACVHNPPPPSNQIIRARFEPPFELHEMWSPFWITGRLETGTAVVDLHEEGYESITNVSSGYSMTVESIDPYTWE